MKSVAIMLERIHALEGTTDLSKWEQGFVVNVWQQSRSGKDTSQLSGPTIEIIERIFNKHFGD